MINPLPPEVEAVLWAGSCNEGCDGCPPPNDCPINAIESPCWLISTLRAQAEEIERLEDYAEGLKFGASIVREERDRYKAMDEWLKGRIAQRIVGDVPPREDGGDTR